MFKIMSIVSMENSVAKLFCNCCLNFQTDIPFSCYPMFTVNYTFPEYVDTSFNQVVNIIKIYCMCHGNFWLHSCRHHYFC